MSVLERYYGRLDEAEIAVNPNEAALRLGVARGYTNELIERCEKRLRDVVEPAYSAVRVRAEYPAENKLELGFGVIESRALYRNLAGCGEVFVFAVTVGHGADRLIKRLSVTSAAESFITDALASAFAEAACDRVSELLRGEARCRARFSPGFGDLPLSVQPKVLELTQARQRLGITLTAALLMAPSKSVTAIMGIEKGNEHK